MLWLIEFAGCQFKRQAVEGLDLLFLAFRVFALFYLAFISWPTDHHTRAQPDWAYEFPDRTPKFAGQVLFKYFKK